MQPATPRSQTHSGLRMGSVSFLNARPLIWGLDDRPRSCPRLVLDVPSRLLDAMREGLIDVGLLPVIDYQHMDDLVIIPSGGIGCDGPTLTVRIFGRTPIESVRTLACDPDSHSSVALARVIFAGYFKRSPEFVDLRSDEGRSAEARLLIGDKVVCEEPADMAHQLDLGAAWKQMTGLPFVFAVWMARRGTSLGELPRRLEQARLEGVAHVDQIIARHAVPRGWPAGLARQYLTHYLKYEIGPRQLQAITHFHDLCARYAVLPPVPRPLSLW